MIASNKVMDVLKGIGLNLYERKLWVALLARGTSNAGELSTISKVPRSRAYDILESLAEKGFVVVQNTKPIRYVAIPPKEALERSKKKMEEKMAEMSERIDDLKSSPVMKELNAVYSKGIKVVSSEDISGSLKGKHLEKQQMGTMFRSAKSKISIVTSADGLKELHDEHYSSLKKASEGGVEVKIATVANNKNQNEVKALTGIGEVRHMDSPVSGRFCIVDGKEMIMGLTDPKSVHESQHVSFWSKSDHATGKIFSPVFDMIWKSSKAV